MDAESVGRSTRNLFLQKKFQEQVTLFLYRSLVLKRETLTETIHFEKK